MENITIQKSSKYLTTNLNGTNSLISIYARVGRLIITSLLFLLITLFTRNIQSQWVNVGIPGFSAGEVSYTSLALDGSTPYVAYQDWAYGNKASVMKFDGSTWVNVGTPGFSEGASFHHSLALDGNTPYLAYVDGENEMRTTVKKFDGSTWLSVGIPGFSVENTMFLSLALDGNTPYLAFSQGKTTVMKFDGVGWVIVGMPAFSAGVSVYQSLALDESTPYVAYQDGGNDLRTSVKKFDGLNWVYVGDPGFSEGQADDQSLVLDGSTPYVAYSDWGHGRKTTVMKFDGSDWVYVGMPGFSAGQTYEQSLALDGSTPYVAFKDLENGGRTTVMKFDGTNWIYVGATGFSPGPSFGQSLALNGNNPYVAFYVGSVFDINVMEFCRYPSIPTLSISNALLNGDPITLTCGSTIVISYDPNHPQTLEFNITSTDADLPADQISMSAILPDPDCKIVEFNPALPIGPSHSNIVSHVIVRPNGLAGSCTSSLTFFVVDSCGNKDSCILNFDYPSPVELSSFYSSMDNNNVNLNWATASETNNSGFDIERRDVRRETQDVWNKISFINGHGTTTSPNNYEFTDRNLPSGKYNYRLKQIDFNGNYEYHNLSDEVVIGVPDKFSLEQNYPNPFNPVTNLEFGISNLEFVSLKVYDAQGKEVATLVNEIKPAGRFAVTFDGSNFGSGVYYYKITAGSFSAVKRMILLK